MKINKTKQNPNAKDTQVKFLSMSLMHFSLYLNRTIYCTIY